MKYLWVLLFLTACGTAPIERVRGSVTPDPATVVASDPATTWGTMEYLEDLSIFYDTGSADMSIDSELNFNGWANLKRHAAYLKAHPEAHVTVEGNCDERGSVAYNKALGKWRADTVHRMLLREGVTDSQMSVASNGKSKPLGACHAEMCWRQNRRVDLKYEYLLK